MVEGGADEGWSYEVPKGRSATPEDLTDLVWSYFQWDLANEHAEWAHPNSRAELRRLLDPAFQASLRAEEHRRVRLQIQFDLRPSQLTFTFPRPLAYEVAQLVKLSPAIGVGHRWLVVTPGPSEGREDLQIVGMCDPELSPHPTLASLLTRWVRGMGMHVPETTGIALSVFGPGWLRVATWAQRFFELRDCAIRFPFTVHELEPVDRWYRDAVHDNDLEPANTGHALIRRIWGSVVSRVRDERHGGCIIVVPNEPSLAELPIRTLHAIDSERLQGVVRRRMGLEPALAAHVHGRTDISLEALDDAHFIERDVERIAGFCASLASVDGAVVIRRDLRLVGFGAEIVHITSPRDDERVRLGATPAPGPRQSGDRPLGSLGMRHRSAYRFCQQVPGSLAFVISQDGDLRLFANGGGEVVLYEGATPEDRIMAGA